MIVTNIQETAGTKREVVTEDWTSRRLLLKKDGMGFSMHETVIRAGAELALHYKNHLEAVYCVEGSGFLHDKTNDITYAIESGVLYALNDNDPHTLKANTYMRMVCVFNPPVTGEEKHDKEGAYPIIDEESI
jgi:L-ectoine synthase